MAADGTKRSRGSGRNTIEEAYGHIKRFCAKCRILSDLVGIYVLNSGVRCGKNFLLKPDLQLTKSFGFLEHFLRGLNHESITSSRS